MRVYYCSSITEVFYFMKKNKGAKKTKTLWKEFKSFISRGNVVDMAVGVIMGSAFGAIVTAFTNILLSVCTWGVPGGLKGLVTVLPAANATQAGIEGIGQKFDVSELQEMTAIYAGTKGVAVNDGNYAALESALTSKYTLHGSTYFYNGSSLIDWGSFINAIISFLIIALTLFTILKVYNWSKQKRLALQAKMQEEYFVKHPEERPAPVEPGKPAPTEVELLSQIRDELKALHSEEKEQK